MYPALVLDLSQFSFSSSICRWCASESETPFYWNTITMVCRHTDSPLCLNTITMIRRDTEKPSYFNIITSVCCHTTSLLYFSTIMLIYRFADLPACRYTVISVCSYTLFWHAIVLVYRHAHWPCTGLPSSSFTMYWFTVRLIYHCGWFGRSFLIVSVRFIDCLSRSTVYDCWVIIFDDLCAIIGFLLLDAPCAIARSSYFDLLCAFFLSCSLRFFGRSYHVSCVFLW